MDVTEVILGSQVIWVTEIWLTWYASSCCGVKMVCLFPISPWCKARYAKTQFYSGSVCLQYIKDAEQIFQLWNACDNEDLGRTEVDQISHCVSAIIATFHRFHCPEWQALFGRECVLSVSGSASGTVPLLRTGGGDASDQSQVTHVYPGSQYRRGFRNTKHHESAM